MKKSSTTMNVPARTTGSGAQWLDKALPGHRWAVAV
jgi:hypothetical protein